MKQEINVILNQLSEFLNHLDSEKYAQYLAVLNGNSIGKHVRHILDLFDCLIRGSEMGILNYDHRNRDLTIENSPEFASKKIKEIQQSILNLDLQKKLNMFQNLGNTEIQIETNLERELLYNIEHTIHHLAIIRIAIEQHFPEISLPKHFGIAYSTIQHCEQQA